MSAINVPKLPAMSLFEPRKKVKQKDSDLKISSPVVQIERKNRKKKVKLQISAKLLCQRIQIKSSNMCWKCAKTA